ncbi:MAG TPA: Ppx/GppA phosphatase family protein [Caulobacteraceae bacterium]|nr:Ppx/GppA phosphatase family protein [Caulobacteraceae bacterium]
MAAIDLGTNNCRLLIAAPARAGFRVVDAYSRIIRLGEGVSRTGVLAPAAMTRAFEALSVCAERMRRRGVMGVRAVATEACRTAGNGASFIAEVERRTGIRLEVIAPRREAELAVAGCLDLIDARARAVLVLDVGGGSTELSWLDLHDPFFGLPLETAVRRRPPLHAWLSVPIGVVSLAEAYPESREDVGAWFGAMVDHVKGLISPFTGADRLRGAFGAGRAHLIGASGAITSLAGVGLGLPRYRRERVDGLWLTRADCEATAARIAGLDPGERAQLPCIGPERADLVLAGAAILQAVQELWPCERVRVADRGLREGLILGLLAERRRTRWPGPVPAGARAR